GGFGVNGFIDQYGVLPPSTSILTNQQSGVLLNGTFSGTTVGTFAGNVSGQFNGTGAISNALIAAAASTLIGTLPAAQLPAVVVTNNYNLKAYGAYGDAHYANGALAVSNSTTVTVTGANFTGAEVGWFIDFKGAAINRRDYWTTITAVNGPNSINIATAVPVSYNLALPGTVAAMSGGYDIRYGQHDDSAAIQAWCSQNTNGGGRFEAPPGLYLMLCPPTNGNAQINIPICLNGTNNTCPIMELFGHLGSKPGVINTLSRSDYDSKTTVFLSNLGTTANLGGWSNGMPSSVFDFRPPTIPTGMQLGTITMIPSGGIVTNQTVYPYWHDFVLETSVDPSCIALNFIGAQETSFNNLIVGYFIGPDLFQPMCNTNGWAVVMPCNYSGAAGECKNSMFTGFYNGLDMGLIRGDYLTFDYCSNALTALYTGAAAQQVLHNLQFTCCPIWVYGSGNPAYYSGGGAPAGAVCPQIDVLDYQGTITGNQVPDWTTNSSYAVYDPQNKLCTGGSFNPPGHIIFPAASASGANATVLQGSSGKNMFASWYYGGGTNVTTAPQWFYGPSMFTNTALFTASTSISNLNVQGNGNFITYGSRNVNIGNSVVSFDNITGGSDLIYQSISGNGNAGRNTKWLWGLDDTTVDGNAIYDLYHQSQLSGVNTVYGFYGKGYTWMETTNGNQYFYGGIYTSNAVWLATNNVTPPAVRGGFAGIWSSNGWLYSVTAQHPNGVLISAP
ncbi:MAG: hypothetical protein P4L87_24345, partial [Formivibrio sp.]|nr:hypothetical protein [Formivibrio sp.]